MASHRPIYLFTDYGLAGPYVGQLRAAIYREGFSGRIVDLQHDAPAFNPVAAGILLAALLKYLPQDAVIVAVVDPGVGGDRGGIALSYGGRLLVGPDNCLFAPLLETADWIEHIDWVPPTLSATFHGRDWFAPVGARLAMGKPVGTSTVSMGACAGFSLAEDLAQVIYFDAFGNAITGLLASSLGAQARLGVGQVQLHRARTFSDAPRGQAFWYENSMGLAEIAVNQGSAREQLRLELGDEVCVLE
jgi:S-adenosylmethionine hydrolase